MKRVLSVILIIIPVLLSGNTVLTVAYENREQPPYYTGNNEEIPAKLPGAAVEMVQLLQRYIPGLQIKLVRYPWKRCLFALQHNRVDGIFNASYLPERRVFGRYPTINWQSSAAVNPAFRITTIAYHLYLPVAAASCWNGQRFTAQPAVTGVMRGYSIAKFLTAHGLKIEEHSSNLAILRKLAAGRIQAAAMQSVTADALLRRYPELRSRIRKLQPPLKVKPYYLMLSKEFVQKNKQLAVKIWKTLAVIRRTMFARLVRRYK